MHVKYLGVPSEELKLRIWWDYDNNPTQYKDITIGDSDLLGRDDGLVDIEMLIEHTYDGLNGSEKRKVRVELIRKGETGNCARARTITVKAEKKTSEGTSSGAHVLKSGDAVWTTATLRAFSAPTAPPVFYLPPSFAPSPGEFKAFCNALGLSFNMASLPGPIATPFPAVPGPAVFPDVVDSWNPTAFLDMGSNTLGIGPHASVLEIDTRAAQAQIASAISTLSQFELRIYRTRSGVETLIFSASLADLQIRVTDTGPGVSFKFQWNKTFDPGLVDPTDLLRYEIHGMN
jgi:hypothetical protein